MVAWDVKFMGFFSLVDLWTLRNVVSTIPTISSISVSIDTSGQNLFSCSVIKGLFEIFMEFESKMMVS